MLLTRRAGGWRCCTPCPCGALYVVWASITHPETAGPFGYPDLDVIRRWLLTSETGLFLALGGSLVVGWIMFGFAAARGHLGVAADRRRRPGGHSDGDAGGRRPVQHHHLRGALKLSGSPHPEAAAICTSWRAFTMPAIALRRIADHDAAGPARIARPVGGAGGVGGAPSRHPAGARRLTRPSRSTPRTTSSRSASSST